MAGIAVNVDIGSAAATDTVGVGGRLQQRHKLVVSLAGVSPAVRVHLTTLVGGVLGPNSAVHATSDLDIGVVFDIVRGFDVSRGHWPSAVLGGTVAVDGGTSLIGSDRENTLSGQHCAEVVLVGDGGDDAATSGGVSAGNNLTSVSHSHEGGEDSEGFNEHCGCA